MTAIWSKYHLIKEKISHEILASRGVEDGSNVSVGCVLISGRKKGAEGNGEKREQRRRKKKGPKGNGDGKKENVIVFLFFLPRVLCSYWTRLI